MSLGLKESLSVLVKAKYTSAKAAGALTYADSRLAVVPVAGLPMKFQLRFCPSLAKKPTDLQAKEPAPAKKRRFDPFENPDPQLLVCNVPDDKNYSHVVILNKFPIIQNHVVLATRSSKHQQSQLLDVKDLVRTHQSLTEWEINAAGDSDKGGAFAFFNSGEHSGASQPHRHLQILPVQDMREGDDNKEWNLLIDEILQAQTTTFASYEFHIHPNLPFVHFGRRLPPNCNEQILWKTFTDLYKATLASVRHFRTSNPDELPLHPTLGNASPISYNVGMTKSGMVMCPRRSEGLMVRREDGSEIDYVALNGTLLGGTLMVKNEELWHMLKDESAKLLSVLEAIGIPREYEKLDESDFVVDTETLKFNL